MLKKCIGCGITLQNDDKTKLGYTPELNNDLCERCFKLKNYNILTNEGLDINNEDIIKKINESNALTLYLIDFLNIDEEVISEYQKIKGLKKIILTKTDIIPKNIKLNVLIENIKKTYNIEEEIIPCSSKNRFNLSIITNLCKEFKKVILAGFTNAGKSSLINALVGSDITVSKRANTTQDFIELKVDGIKIIDAPGFMSTSSRDNMLPKNIIKPLTYQLKSIYHLLINDINLYINNDVNMTLYLNNEIAINKRRNKEEVIGKIKVPKNYDLVLIGIGFIKFSEEALIDINCESYEIRPSIVGGKNE